jgi:type I restriction enzyme, S subunit
MGAQEARVSAHRERWAALRANPDWAKLPLFDRANWQRVKFDDVVENLSETERNPANAGIERFIGLEHLEPGSLHIRSWGNVADGTTFNRRCRLGQVLFGKRRAYQRKVAVAEFDAVVSGDIYVLAPKGKRLLPELLPFLCMSERFFQHAVGTSAGSLSPRTNWSSLASFEFDLPSLEQQRRIAQVLWAADAAIETSVLQHSALGALKYRAFEQRTIYGKSKFPVRLLGDVTTSQYGLSCPLGETGTYPILRMMNFDEELIAVSDLKFADLPTQVAAEYILQRGDVLFNRTNSADLVGKAGIFDLEGCYLFASYLVRIKTDRSILLPEFLNYYLNSDSGQAAVRAFATPGVSQTNISAGSLKKVYVPVPPLSEQTTIVRELSKITETRRTAGQQLDVKRAMRQELTNSLIG